MPVNMSYCRYENTLSALRECHEEAPLYPEDDLSERELKAFRKLVKLCRMFADDWESWNET